MREPMSSAWVADAALIEPHAGLEDQRLPFGLLGQDERGKLLWRQRRRNGVEGLELFFDLGAIEYGDGGFMQARKRIERRARRRDEAIPVVGNYARITGLGRCRYIRERRRPLG